MNRSAPFYPRSSVGLVVVLAGCFLRQPEPRHGNIVDSVQVNGWDGSDELNQGLATQPTPTFLGFQGIGEGYEVLDAVLLERDIDRIQRYLQARGYYEARVRSARVLHRRSGHVDIQFEVRPGPRTQIAAPDGGQAIVLEGLESVQDTGVIAKVIAATPVPGSPFDEHDYDESKAEIVRILQDSGYAFAQVDGNVHVDVPARRATLVLRIDAGPKSTFGRVDIVGLETLDESLVRRSIQIHAGQPYTASAVEDARRQLVQLGVFTTVRVQQDVSAPQTRAVPVVFTLQESPHRTLRLGAGARVDALQLAAGLSGSWRHNNLFGGMRNLSVDLRSGIILFPTRTTQLERPQRTLAYGNLGLRFRQPSFLEGRTFGFASSSLDVRPLLYADSSLDEAMLGFLQARGALGAERQFWQHRVQLSLSLNWLTALPIDYRSLSWGVLGPPADTQALDTLTIAFPELGASLDLRDNPIAPREGVFIAASAQTAVPALGGDLFDVRIQPEARAFFTRSKLTLALRVKLGALLPANYSIGKQATNINEQHRLLFRGFFSGGPFSNRGYAFKGVGPHAFLALPGGTTEECARNLEANTELPECQRPVGGLSAWEASVELRYPVPGLAPLGSVLFLDASDVQSTTLTYTLSDPHLSPGLGLRYPTPVGAVRLDLGLRLSELLGTEDPQGSPPRLGGLPIALHFAIGEAF